MQDLIWLLPTFPLLGFLMLVLTSGNLSRQIVAFIGAGSVGLSFIAAIFIAFEFLASGEDYFVKEVWTWMSVGVFNPGFSFYLDGFCCRINYSCCNEFLRSHTNVLDFYYGWYPSRCCLLYTSPSPRDS